MHLDYRNHDATAAVHVTLGAADERNPWRFDDAEEITRGDRIMRVRRRTDAWPQAQLLTVLGDTRVMLSSDSLGADDLVELTDRLGPAPDTPPSL